MVSADINANNTKYCTVTFPVAAPGSYTYEIPITLVPLVALGSRVCAELRKKKCWGVVTAIDSDPPPSSVTVKPVLQVSPEFPIFSPEFIRLLLWMSDYYLARPGDVLAAAVPKLFFRKLEKFQFDKTKQERSRLLSAEMYSPLFSEQQEVVNEISVGMEKRRHAVFLLQGITGSGKSHVYYSLVRKALSLNRTSLVLVPEISLTPQTVKNFKDIFGDEVAVLHSGLTEKERVANWMQLLSGVRRIAVGVRSAIFAPIANIGLIVVDEEHDGSYSQGDRQFSYHARDAAVMRAKLENAVVVLGSATPSLESRRNADAGKYKLLQLTKRFENRPLPKVHLVDLKKEKEILGNAIFSRLLKEKMEERFERGEQIILLKNRRGFSPFVQCAVCGHVPKCPHCSVSLTYHKGVGRLVCHYCDKRSVYSDLCPDCGKNSLFAAGAGVERVQEELKKLYPGVRLLRLDLDTGSRSRATSEILDKFRKGEADVLVGTQMVSKGLDFHRVTLVGVLLAETGLLLPDFRAQERAFQLLTQVAGRSGRGETEGEVVIQTYLPEERTILAAVAQDYEKFYSDEIKTRGALRYPPFTRAVLVRFQSKNSERAAVAAAKFASALPNTVVRIGPAPAPIEKVRGAFRHFVLLRSGSSTELHQAVRVGTKLCALSPDRQVKMQIVFDPDGLL